MARSEGLLTGSGQHARQAGANDVDLMLAALRARACATRHDRVQATRAACPVWARGSGRNRHPQKHEAGPPLAGKAGLAASAANGG
jgi:hypothetical protein